MSDQEVEFEDETNYNKKSNNTSQESGEKYQLGESCDVI